MSYNKPQPPNVPISHMQFMGMVMYELCEYMGTYEISFQFWGDGNNNVFIAKDGVDLFESGGHETPFAAMITAREYLDRINNKIREYNDQ